MRTFPTGFGVVLLALAALLLIGFGSPSDPATAVQLLAFALAGVLLLASGVVEEFPIGGRGIEWHVPFGIGLSLVGLSFSFGLLVTSPAEGSVGRVLVAALALANALLFVHIGFDTARGNTYADALKPR